MIANADALLEELADRNEKGTSTSGQLFKIKADLRITRAGRSMRKVKHGELPRLSTRTGGR